MVHTRLLLLLISQLVELLVANEFLSDMVEVVFVKGVRRGPFAHVTRCAAVLGDELAPQEGREMVRIATLLSLHTPHQELRFKLSNRGRIGI